MQNRMENRLRKLCNSYKGRKPANGKPINGKNRQNYYGMVIRANTDSLVDTFNGVSATLYHVASTDDDPSHALCPSGEYTWCRRH